MFFKFPKDTQTLSWTRHIKNKMLFYGLSEARIKRILTAPDRIEEGVAERTLAAMQRSTGKKKPEEIWIMYQKTMINRQGAIGNKEKQIIHAKRGTPSRILMISAWRYPGVTKPGAPIPIPDDIINALSEEGISIL